jgi:hypothetical protein
MMKVFPEFSEKVPKRDKKRVEKRGKKGVKKGKKEGEKKKKRKKLSLLVVAIERSPMKTSAILHSI